MSRMAGRIAAVFLALSLLVCAFPAPVVGETAQAEEGAVDADALFPPGTVFSNGSSGEGVRLLQQRLRELGYLTGAVDGQFGGDTQRAVLSFQRRNGLDADGIAGQLTLHLLFSQDAKAAPEDTKPVDVLSGELPWLVNLDHPVDEYFVPANLVDLRDELDESLVTIKYRDTRGVLTAVQALRTLLKDAVAQGLKKWQVSAGYRSWEDQVNMLNSKVNSYLRNNEGWSRARARRAALRTVAEPGASEHHLGLAFDVNVKGASSFAGTKQCDWLHAHCWEYGFIIRYQADKTEITGFAAEAWHIRYVGVEHAIYMRDHHLCLEEYLLEKENLQGENTGFSDEQEASLQEGNLSQEAEDLIVEDVTLEEADMEEENPEEDHPEERSADDSGASEGAVSLPEGVAVYVDDIPLTQATSHAAEGELNVYFTIDGEELLVLPFDEAHTVWIVQPGTGENTVEMTGQAVWMAAADCPGQDCVQMEEVTRDNLEARVLGGFIICLPHLLAIEVR